MTTPCGKETRHSTCFWDGPGSRIGAVATIEVVFEAVEIDRRVGRAFVAALVGGDPVPCGRKATYTPSSHVMKGIYKENWGNLEN